jgi:DNA polymerase I-like protein with 3'-5' exonuclease and polymerase domains
MAPSFSIECPGHTTAMKEYTVIATKRHLAAELARRRAAVPTGAVGFDTETWGLDPRKHPIRTVQLHFRGWPTLVILAERFQRKTLARLIRPIFESRDYLIVGQNLKFDYAMLWHQYGLDIPRLFDTMLAEVLLTAGTYADCDLASIAEKYIDVHLDKTVRLDFIRVKKLRPDMLAYAAHDVQFLEGIMLRQSRALAGAGLMDVARLEFAVLPWLAKAEVAGVRINRERWLRHAGSLASERDRLRIDLELLLQEGVDAYREKATGVKKGKREEKLQTWEAAVKDWEAMLAAHLAPYESKTDAWKDANKRFRNQFKRPTKPGGIKEETGVINLNGPQLAGALLEMGVPLPKNEKGNPDTSKGTLHLLALDYPVLELVLEYRMYEKLVSSFGESIVMLCDALGFLHPTYRQCVSTGRMACKAPNIQQIPAGPLGEEFRHCFECIEGWLLCGADYSQIELRILAEIAGEANMMRAFDDGLDLHSLTALKMFADVRAVLGLESMDDFDALSLDAQKALLKRVEVECKHRRKAAKAINFGIAYGLSAFGLARQLNISQDEAKEYIDAYFLANPSVAAWLDSTAKRALETAYSITLFGRKRFFKIPRRPQWQPPKDMEPEEYRLVHKEQMRDYNRRLRMIGRQACNHPIQGTSADITKMAVVLVSERLAELGIPGGVRLVVHDEIVVLVPAEYAEQVKALLQECMVTAARRLLKRVPVPVTATADTYWNH